MARSLPAAKPEAQSAGNIADKWARIAKDLQAVEVFDDDGFCLGVSADGSLLHYQTSQKGGHRILPDERQPVPVPLESWPKWQAERTAKPGSPK